jgi:hypothetical protein
MAASAAERGYDGPLAPATVDSGIVFPLRKYGDRMTVFSSDPLSRETGVLAPEPHPLSLDDLVGERLGIPKLEPGSGLSW